MGWLFIWPLHVLAAGVLKLSTTELRFLPDQREGALYAQNTGDSPLFLDVEQTLVFNPGEQPEQRLALSQVSNPGLLVTPARLVLAPGQRYRMNIKTLGNPAVNQVWRVTFRPRENVIVQTQGEDGLSAPLSVNVGYGVVIYQNSATPQLHPQQE
ncbi:hypothetical protein GYM98_21435 [Pseudomonas lundensis]|nr:hypothetical protein [Pseudomonas lundensis]